MTQTYFHRRMAELGISDEHNRVALQKHDPATNQTVHQFQPVFTQHEKGIEITVYDLNRSHIRVVADGSRWKKNWSIIRLEKPYVKANGDVMKYQMPKGAGSFPFFPPDLLQKYDDQTVIDTLFLTEGFFKAMKGSIHGIDIVGLPSITHMKEKDTGALHTDILRLIHTCRVRRVVWLVDGDCLDISRELVDEAGKEKNLYLRPANFFNSISTFKQLLDDHDCDKYFMHIDTENIAGKPKGLDDVLVAHPDRIPEIIADLCSVSAPGQWFQKFNITVGLSKVRSYFRLNDVNDFYLYHAERRPDLKGKPFVFNGTKYIYNEEDGKCEIMVPGEAAYYFRVGDDYFKFVGIPNKYGQLERQFRKRMKGTIMDDHGRTFTKHIPKYEAFANVPDHVNFQQVVHNCFNVYSPLEHVPDDEVCGMEDCPTIISFIRHIFGNGMVSFKHPKTGERKEYSNFDLGLDYVQLLYQRPTEKLPILCLVSAENNTGKSTFGKLLKMLFSGNCAIVGNQDLAGDFNAHWTSKLVVICDETKIDKQHVVEKVKSLSTADKVMMNAKGRDHAEIDCFIKFIFITNNEDNFIYATNEDIRYWIMKVPTIQHENPGILENMLEELPAFLSFLNQRKLVTEKLNRMWFYPSLLKTDALKKVVQYSMPTIEKELRNQLREMFLDFGLTEITMTRKAVHREFFNNRYEANYLEKVIKENLKADQFHTLDHSNPDLYGQPAKIYKTCRHSYPKWDVVFENGHKTNARVDVSDNGRPYVFHAADFLSTEEIAAIRADPEFQFNQILSPSIRPSEESPF